jgi:outer membrane protein assembly factor BamB
MDRAVMNDCGVLMAVRASDGAFLWQDAAPRVKRGLREFLLPSTTSAPYVDGDRLYYLTPECQLRCLDVHANERGAALVWELDLCAALGVFPHEACNSEVLPLGELLVVCTSNGQNEGHTRVPSPRAPSLIAVDKRSGKVMWRAIGAGANVLHGQWSSPVAARVNGRTQVLFGGGDGWLRAYDAESGRELWKFDGNPKDAVWRPRPGAFSRCAIVAPPVYDGEGRVFVAMGEDPSHGNGPSLLHAISANGQGDVTETRRLWTCRQIGRVVAKPIVSEGLLYVADLGGRVYCVDAKTGEVIWKHDTEGAIWGCLMLAGGRVYAGNVDGTMTVLRAGRTKEVLAEMEMEAPLYSRPAVVGDAMYVASARRLYLIQKAR